MIPKTIHYIWYSNESKKSLPYVFEKIIEQNCKNNESMDYKLWTNFGDQNEEDEKLEKNIEESFPNLINIIRKTKFEVQKADIKRLAILYFYGGTYIDTDISILQPIEKLINMNEENFIYAAMEPDEQTMKIVNKKNLLCNAFICSPAKHPILKRALEIVENVYEDCGDSVFNIFNCFGADILTKAFIEDINKSYKLIKRNLIYPITDPKFDDLDRSQNDIKKLKSGMYPNAFMVHYWMHSNFESKQLIKTFKWDDNKSLNENIVEFFKQLYKTNKYLKD